MSTIKKLMFTAYWIACTPFAVTFVLGLSLMVGAMHFRAEFGQWVRYLRREWTPEARDKMRVLTPDEVASFFPGDEEDGDGS